MIPASQADYLAIGQGLGASGGKQQANSGLQADWVANGVSRPRRPKPSLSAGP